MKNLKAIAWKLNNNAWNGWNCISTSPAQSIISQHFYSFLLVAIARLNERFAHHEADYFDSTARSRRSIRVILLTCELDCDGLDFLDIHFDLYRFALEAKDKLKLTLDRANAIEHRHLNWNRSKANCQKYRCTFDVVSSTVHTHHTSQTQHIQHSLHIQFKLNVCEQFHPQIWRCVDRMRHLSNKL